MGGGRNDRLRQLMQEANCSHAGLAHRVNELGNKQGMNLRYDKSSVTHWLNGKRPRGIVPSLIAEVLSQQLGRPVTLADIGIDAATETNLGPESLMVRDLSATLDVASELGQADMERRSFLYLLPFSVAASAGPQRNWLLHLLETNRTGGGKTTKEDIAGLRHMMDSFTQADLRLGGAHARLALVSYLTNDVIPLLRRQADNDEVSRQLFAGAADLYMLLGWKTYDTGSYGLAQRYLLQGLQLATEGGDQGLSIGSHLLSSMSHLAVTAGDPGEAVSLARAAVHSAEKAASDSSLTRALAMEARAHASLRDSKAAVRALNKAESVQAKASGDDPAWMAFLDSAYLFNQAAFCFRQLNVPKDMQEAVSLSATGSQGRQVGSNAAYLATAQLRDGEIDEACSNALKAADVAARLQSRMVGILVDDFWAELQESGDAQRIKDFGESLSAIAKGAAES